MYASLCLQNKHMVYLYSSMSCCEIDLADCLCESVVLCFCYTYAHYCHAVLILNRDVDILTVIQHLVLVVH